MTFVEELRAFFKKYDPSRLYLAKKIAAAYKTPKGQKAALKRLKEVYAAGGPDKFDFTFTKKSIEKVAYVAEEVQDKVIETVEEIDDANDEIQEVSE